MYIFIEHRITVTVRGRPDEYGMVMNLTYLKSIMEVIEVEISEFILTITIHLLSMFRQKVIIDRMDHKFLDKDVEYFKTNPSTAENIAIYIWEEMKKELADNLLYEVRIDETGNNTAFYRGEIIES